MSHSSAVLTSSSCLWSACVQWKEVTEPSSSTGSGGYRWTLSWLRGCTSGMLGSFINSDRLSLSGCQLLHGRFFCAIWPVWGQIRPEQTRPSTLQLTLPDQWRAAAMVLLEVSLLSTQDLWSSATVCGHFSSHLVVQFDQMGGQN